MIVASVQKRTSGIFFSIIFLFCVLATESAGANVIIQPRDTTICAGQTVVLHAQVAAIDSGYQEINLQSYFNTSWAVNGNPLIIPAGQDTLGGIPFLLGCNGCNNCWAADYATGPNPIILSVPVWQKADSIYVLINTHWGSCSGSASYESIQFKSGGQVIFQQPLYSGTDIRDFNPSSWCNTINGTSTINVFNGNNGRRLDMVQVNVPALIKNTVIDSILFVDDGENGLIRMVVTGLTIKPFGSASYLWSTGDTTSSILVSPTQTDTYYVTVTQNDSSAADSALVTVENPVVTITPNGPASFCAGGNVSLDAGAGFDNYAWSNNETNQSITVNAAGAYAITVTDSSGCSASSNTITVTIYPLPVDTVVSDKNKICSNDSAHVCSTPGYTNYQWNTGDAGMCIEASQAGDYYVTVTDNNGCTAQSNHVSISVYPPASISISEAGDTLTSYGIYNCQWYLNDSAIHSATGPVYIAIAQGSYTVQVTDTNGCTSVSNPIFVSGISQLAQEHFSIFPNPTANSFMVLTTATENSVLQVFDVKGKLLLQQNIESNQTSVDASRLAAGVYVVVMRSDEEIAAEKLVIEK